MDPVAAAAAAAAAAAMPAAAIIVQPLAVPKQFKRGTNAAGGIMGANPYRNNQDP